MPMEKLFRHRRSLRTRLGRLAELALVAWPKSVYRRVSKTFSSIFMLLDIQSHHIDVSVY